MNRWNLPPSSASLARPIRAVPTLVVLAVVALLLAHGPIQQPPDYHRFADRSVVVGIPYAADVLSNLGFALVAAWGWGRLRGRRDHPGLARGWAGYRLFLVALLLTAFGSAYYHWAPDDARLVWDRLPIALVCAGLLSAVRAETHPGDHRRTDTAWWALFAIISVLWWAWTESQGQGDLRPYLLIQGLPLVLIPLWQGIHHAPRRDRLAFALALLLYVLARAAELFDHELLALLGSLSGHTLKHLLAAGAAAVWVARLAERVRDAPSAPPPAATPGPRCSENA